MSFDLLQKLQEYRSEAQPKQKLQQSLIKVVYLSILISNPNEKINQNFQFNL